MHIDVWHGLIVRWVGECLDESPFRISSIEEINVTIGTNNSPIYNGAGESVLFKEIIMIYFKMNFSKTYTDLILKYADKYKPFKYNTKYSNKYYLKHIFNVLGDVVTWKALMNLKTIVSNHEYHYKTISKMSWQI